MLRGTRPPQATSVTPDLQSEHVYSATRMTVHHHYAHAAGMSPFSYIAPKPTLAFPGYVYPVDLSYASSYPTLVIPPTQQQPEPLKPASKPNDDYTAAIHPRIRKNIKPETVALKNKMQQSQLQWVKRRSSKRKLEKAVEVDAKAAPLKSAKVDPVQPTEATVATQVKDDLYRIIAVLTQEKKVILEENSRLYRELEHWKSKCQLLENQGHPQPGIEVFGPHFPPPLTYAHNKASDELLSIPDMLKAFDPTPPGSAANSPMKPRTR